MKLLSIWQGLRLSAMSPWYHAAAFIAGLCISDEQNPNNLRVIVAP